MAPMLPPAFKARVSQLQSLSGTVQQRQLQVHDALVHLLHANSTNASNASDASVESPSTNGTKAPSGPGPHASHFEHYAEMAAAKAGSKVLVLSGLDTKLEAGVSILLNTAAPPFDIVTSCCVGEGCSCDPKKALNGTANSTAAATQVLLAAVNKEDFTNVVTLGLKTGIPNDIKAGTKVGVLSLLASKALAAVKRDFADLDNDQWCLEMMPLYKEVLNSEWHFSGGVDSQKGHGPPLFFV